MTAMEALDAANAAAPGERLRRFESRCGPWAEACKPPPPVQIGRRLQFSLNKWTVARTQRATVYLQR